MRLAQTALGKRCNRCRKSYWLKKEEYPVLEGLKGPVYQSLDSNLVILRWQMSILYCLKLPPGSAAMFCQFISVRDQLVFIPTLRPLAQCCLRNSKDPIQVQCPARIEKRESNFKV